MCIGVIVNQQRVGSHSSRGYKRQKWDEDVSNRAAIIMTLD